MIIPASGPRLWPPPVVIRVGQVTGLAVTEVGGDRLTIACVPAKASDPPGSLGEVMPGRSGCADGDVTGRVGITPTRERDITRARAGGRRLKVGRVGYCHVHGAGSCTDG